MTCPGNSPVMLTRPSRGGAQLQGLPDQRDAARPGVTGAGVALSMPAMADAIMSAIPPEEAGVGAAINGTLAAFGNGLGVAVLGAVPQLPFRRAHARGAPGGDTVEEMRERDFVFALDLVIAGIEAMVERSRSWRNGCPAPGGAGARVGESCVRVSPRRAAPGSRPSRSGPSAQA